jgi:hypothetical protein
MEETLKATPAQIEQQIAELVPLQVIRTETVLSKLPIHNLAKRGNVDINIVRRNRDGEIDLKWIVSYSDRYGQPRQMGYKLDTIVINRRIDEAGRPLPELIRLGSLREIALDLGLGSNTSAVRQALLQNASAFITARLQYTGTDKRQRTLEAGFSRYSVIFTGDQLPSGEKADAVYIELNTRYREVLNNALFRPLNYDYMRELSPAAQRFYEVVSRSIFAALKHQHAEARLSYAEFCTCSAQQRYYDYDHFKKQMYKIHRPHLASGYLKAIRYAATKDGEGKSDWDMFYTPGPKARVEHHTFTKSGRVIDPAPEVASSEVAITPQSSKPRSPTRQKRFSFTPPPQSAVPSELVTELGEWGIGETAARTLLSSLPATQPVRDQIDYALAQIKKGRIDDPAAFIVSIIKKNDALPPTFETRARRQAREEAQHRRDRHREAEDYLWNAYRDYQSQEIDRYIAAELTAEGRDKLTRLELDECRRKHPNVPKKTIEEMVPHGLRQRVAQNIKFLTFEEFRMKLDRGEITPIESPVE